LYLTLCSQNSTVHDWTSPLAVVVWFLSSAASMSVRTAPGLTLEAAGDNLMTRLSSISTEALCNPPAQLCIATPCLLTLPPTPTYVSCVLLATCSEPAAAEPFTEPASEPLDQPPASARHPGLPPLPPKAPLPLSSPSRALPATSPACQQSSEEPAGTDAPPLSPAVLAASAEPTKSPLKSASLAGGHWSHQHTTLTGCSGAASLVHARCSQM
jgi:hypothetical protein